VKCLGLHNKPTAKVHPGHMLTGPKEEEEEEEEEYHTDYIPSAYKVDTEILNVKFR
jgi:hypothetical protein